MGASRTVPIALEVFRKITSIIDYDVKGKGVSKMIYHNYMKKLMMGNNKFEINSVSCRFHWTCTSCSSLGTRAVKMI